MIAFLTKCEYPVVSYNCKIMITMYDIINNFY